MDSEKGILSSITGAITERFQSPFIGTFLLSFIAFNWKPILIVLFASESIQEKIEIVEKDYTGAWWSLPILFSIFYVVVLPYIMWGIDWLSEKAIKGRKEHVHTQRMSDMDDRIRLAEKERKLEEERAGTKIIANLKQDIEVLQTQLDSRDSTLKQLNTELNDAVENHNLLISQLNKERNSNEKHELDEQYQYFKSLGLLKSFQKIASEVIQKNHISSKNINPSIINEFINLGILREIVTENNSRPVYILTSKGEYFWKVFNDEFKNYKN